LDPVILAFLLPTALKRYCIQIFAARYLEQQARTLKLYEQACNRRCLQESAQRWLAMLILECIYLTAHLIQCQCQLFCKCRSPSQSNKHKKTK